MNTFRNNVFRIAGCMAMALMIFIMPAYATEGGQDDKANKTTQKAREAVADAPDDWQVLTKSAERCIRKNTNLEEAYAWLEQSMEIEENPYTLRVMGDYYASKTQNRKAMEFYIKSLQLGLENNVNYKDTQTQQKVDKLRKESL